MPVTWMGGRMRKSWTRQDVALTLGIQCGRLTPCSLHDTIPSPLLPPPPPSLPPHHCLCQCHHYHRKHHPTIITTSTSSAPSSPLPLSLSLSPPSPVQPHCCPCYHHSSKKHPHGVNCGFCYHLCVTEMQGISSRTQFRVQGWLVTI